MSGASTGIPTGSNSLRKLYWALVLTLSLTPFVLVILISFGEKIEGAAWIWGLDLSNYRRFMVGNDWPNSTSYIYLSALWHSIFYAVVASLLAVVTAFPFVFLLTQMTRRAQTVWLVFFLATMTFSEVFIVMGWDILLSNRSGVPMYLRELGITDWLKEAGWFQVLRDLGLANPRDVRFKPTTFATVLTLVYLVWPYAVILMYPAISKIDKEVLEAARTMGAGTVTVVRTVVLPLARNAIAGTAMILFVFLLGAYVTIAVFAHPSKHTLAITVYESVRGATLNAPFGAAQAVVLLLAAAAVLLASQWVLSRGNVRGSK